MSRVTSDAVIAPVPPWHERIEDLRRAASDPGEGPTLSVIMRTQGRRRHTLVEALTCLAAQSCDAFEVLLCVHSAIPGDIDTVRTMVEGFVASFRSRVRLVIATGGARSRPLNAGVEHARGYYVAFLDDDDIVSTDWIAQFVEGIRAAPAHVVRCVSAEQIVAEVGGPSTPYRASEPVVPPRHPRFDLVGHLHENRTPICSFAVPRAMFSKLGLRFAEDVEVCEDWEVLVTAAMVCGVHDTGACTSLYHRWSTGVSALNTVPEHVWVADMARIRGRFNRAPVLLPAGAALEIAGLVARAQDPQALDAALTDARRRLAAEWRAKTYRREALSVSADARRLARRVGAGITRRIAELRRPQT